MIRVAKLMDSHRVRRLNERAGWVDVNFLKMVCALSRGPALKLSLSLGDASNPAF